MSPRVPVLAAAVVTLPTGQTRFAFPGVARSPYATGQQEPCTDCAAAGLDGQGVSRDGPGSAPLCLTCWRSRQRRAPRRGLLTPEETGQLAELQEQQACPACRPDAAPAEVDLPPAAVEAARRRRRRDRARGRRSGPTRRRTGPRRREGCWRCADASWLADARAVHERDQAAAAADVERVDELRAAHRRTLRTVVRARKRLGYVQAWQARVAGVIGALPKLTKTGSRGRLELKAGPGARARPVWLIADFLDRQRAERAARGVTGGRPPQHHLVVGVMAIAADPAAGLRSMAGLNPTAVFAGVTTRTVTNAWDYAELVGAVTEVERGRTCSLAEREETGLHRRRSVYDFAQLHESPFDPQPHLGAAAAVVATLLQRAVQLVDEHQAVLEDAEQQAALAEAELLDAQAWVAERTAEDLLLQASVSDVWAEDAKAAAQAARTARGRANLAAAPPVHVQAQTAADRTARQGRERLVATVQGAFDTALRMDSFFHPPRMGSRERSSSGRRGLQFSAQPTSPVAGGQRPAGRGEEHRGGASRPSPTRSVTRQSTPIHHRTVKGVRAGSPARPSRSEVMSWAKPLAAGLAGRWEFLARFLADADDGRRDARAVARERALRLAMIATTLGPRLSRRWTPAQVVALVERYGLTGRYAAVRTVIGAGDAHSPLRYLAAVLDRALTHPDAIVAHHSPVRAAFERDVLAVELAAQAEHTAALRAQLAEQADVAAADRAAGRLDGLHAARAAAAGGRTVARPSRHREPGDAERMAAARAELAARAAAAVPGDGEQPWSEPVAQPGAGLPSGWTRGRDR